MPSLYRFMALSPLFISCCFTLFVRGGPCQLSSFTQCSVFSSDNSSFVHLCKKNISDLCYYVINILGLMLSSKTTRCPFKSQISLFSSQSEHDDLLQYVWRTPILRVCCRSWALQIPRAIFKPDKRSVTWRSSISPLKPTSSNRQPKHEQSAHPLQFHTPRTHTSVQLCLDTKLLLLPPQPE